MPNHKSHPRITNHLTQITNQIKSNNDINPRKNPDLKKIKFIYQQIKAI